MDDTRSESEQVTIRKYTPQTELEKLLDKQRRYIFNEAVKYRELSEKQANELAAQIALLKECLEVIREALESLPYSPFDAKAAALLPKLEAATEEVEGG